MSLSKILRSSLLNKFSTVFHPQKRLVHYKTLQHETPDEYICRYVCFFNRPEIDGWDIRQAMNDLAGYDAVPDPKIIIAALLACRRANDYALTVRFLESVKDKCGNRVNEIYPYIIQEVGPIVAELGCDFPEDLGFDKPEHFCGSVFEVHEKEPGPC